MRERQFLHFCSQRLGILVLIFVPLVTVVQLYVITKLEVFTVFLFLENRRHRMDGQTPTDRQTDRRDATLNGPIRRAA